MNIDKWRLIDMIKVDNKHIISDVSKKTYNANKKRNLLTIFAIFLTTFSILTIIGIGIGYWEMISERQMKMNGMDYDIEVSEPTEDQVNIARKSDLIKYAGISVKCAVIESANDRILSKIQLYWVDETCLEKQCLPAMDSLVGDYPQQKNEIMLSKEALRNMGINNPNIGMEIKVEYTALNQNSTDGNSQEINFILSGYYIDFSGDSRGYVSDIFYKDTGAKQTDFTQGTMKLTLKNPLYSEKTIQTLQKQFHLENGQVINADYESINTFIKTVFVLFGLLIIIFLSGYLFIYNTLYISVSKDIRYYGQLKTLGMTFVQLKTLVLSQALRNACFGIPIGLIVGCLVSIKIIPTILKVQNPDLASNLTFSYYPILIGLTTVFSLLTVIISSRQPATVAGKCSPIEAIRYTNEKSKSYKRTNGVRWMAWRNIFRDKKKTIIVLSSFVISIVIFFTINVVIKENDAESILNKTYSYDLQLVDETYFDANRVDSITPECIKKIENINGVSDVRPIYSTLIKVPYQEEVFDDFYKDLYDSRYSPGDYEKDIQKYKDGDSEGLFESKLIGIDNKELELLLKESGIEINKDEFEKGNIALTAGWLSIMPTNVVGKKVEFSLLNEEKVQSLDIEGVVKDPTYFSGGYNPTLIVSTSKFFEIVDNPMVELAYVDYKTSFDNSTEKQIKKIFEDSKTVSFDSKLDLYTDMSDSEMKIKVWGNGIGIIIAIIAIMNYINMMAAGVENRQKEFAILESIGMTKKQTRKTLICEGAGYAIISSVSAIIIAIPISYIVFSSMNIYGIEYSIPILPNSILLCIILVICVSVPPIIYNIFCKGSVLERIRRSEE